MTTSDWGALDPAWVGIREEVLQLESGPVRLLRADGAGSASNAEPQLLVHGLGGSASNWIDVMVGLTQYGPVVALDLPGFGHTPAATGSELTVDGHSEAVLAVADALGWDTFALHGNSMGGLISILLAAAHPDRVSRLVLVSPGLPATCPLTMLLVPRATLDGMLPIAIPRGGSSRAQALLGLIFTDADTIRPALLDAMAADSRPRDEQEAADHREALLRSTASIARMWIDPRRAYRAVDAVQAPTIILGGTADALVPARVLRAVLQRRSDWEGAVLDDHRHALMLENPSEFLARLQLWHSGSSAAVA